MRKKRNATFTVRTFETMNLGTHVLRKFQFIIITNYNLIQFYRKIFSFFFLIYFIKHVSRGNYINFVEYFFKDKSPRNKVKAFFLL